MNYSTEENNFSFLKLFSSTLTIITTTTAGYIIKVPSSIKPHYSGAAIGFLVGSLDEIMIYNNFYQKHILSMSSFFYSIANPIAYAIGFIPGLNLIPSSAIKIIPAAIGSVISNDFISYTNKTILVSQAVSSFLEITDEDHIISIDNFKKIGNELIINPVNATQLILDDINNLYHKPLFMNMAKHLILENTSKIINNFINYKLVAYSGDSMITNLLSPSTLNYKKDIIVKGGLITLAFLSKSIIEMFIKSKIHQLSIEQANIFNEKSMSIIFNQNNGNKILSLPEGEQLISKLNHDFRKICLNVKDSVSQITDPLLIHTTI